MRHDHGGAILAHHLELVHDVVLGGGIQGGSRFVAEQDRGILQHGTRNRDYTIEIRSDQSKSGQGETHWTKQNIHLVGYFPSSTPTSLFLSPRQLHAALSHNGLQTLRQLLHNTRQLRLGNHFLHTLLWLAQIPIADVVPKGVVEQQCFLGNDPYGMSE